MAPESNESKSTPTTPSGKQGNAWRVMTLQEYGRDRKTFGPHRVELRYGVDGCDESAEIHVFLLPSRTIVATGEAVCVSVSKATILNEGGSCFEKAWEMIDKQLAEDYPGQHVREVEFFDAGEAVEIKFHLAKVLP